MLEPMKRCFTRHIDLIFFYSSVYFDLQANLRRVSDYEEILMNRARQLELLNLRKINRIDNLIDINKMQGEVV